MAYSWTDITSKVPLPANFNPGTTILLTDGSVLCQSDGSTKWKKYQPSSQGKYEIGSWVGLEYNMSKARTWYGSGILRDGRVFVMGAEYLNGVKNSDMSTGEIFDPTAPANSAWSAIYKPAAFNFITGDTSSCVLADGRVLFGGADDQLKQHFGIHLLRQVMPGPSLVQASV